MPRWQHISYIVVVIELMEKVHPGGDSWLQTLLCEFTKLFVLEVISENNCVFEQIIYEY